jgi:colanic acid/amylovoran biosynthesis glycosyltransferase
MAVVGHSVNPFLFGTGSWIYGQVRGLSRWRAVVVCKRRENREQFPFEAVHAREDLGLLRQLAERAGRRRHGYFPFQRKALLGAGARLLHSHFATQGWADLALAEALGVPHVTSFYGADIWKNSLQASWRARFAELFERGSLFLVEGNAMRAKVLSLGCPPEKVRVQHLGVDLAGAEFRERAPDPEEGLVRFLAAGRAVEKKGFAVALRAFALAHRRHPRLRLSLMLIARTGAERERVRSLEAAVRAKGLAGAVDFPPPLPYAEYRAALARYHVFLAPSVHSANGDAEGGAPVTAIEMSAAGLPVIASDHCDLPEVVRHGETGLIVPERDVDALADALLTLAAAPERWPEMGRAGRAHVEREYDLATQVERLEALYDELAAGRVAGP